MSLFRCVTSLAVMTASLSSAAFQSEPVSGVAINASPNSLVYQASTCAKTADNKARLKCYDAIFSEKFEKVTSTAKIPDAIPSDKVTMRAQSTAVSLPQTDAINVQKAAQIPAQTIQSAVPIVKVIEPAPPRNTASKVAEFGSESLKSKVTEDLTRIDALVSKITEGPRKERTFYLDNGQVWRESSRARVRFKVGTVIYIEKGAIGSFHLGKDGSTRRIRVKRIK